MKLLFALKLLSLMLSLLSFLLLLLLLLLRLLRNNEVANGDAAVTVVEADVASFHRALVTTQKQFFEPERLPGLFTL